MRMRLYHVVSEHGSDMFIAASNSHHSAEIFVCFELAGERPVGDFSIERCDTKLSAEQQLGLEEMLAWGVAGIARFDGLFGWGVMPPD